MVMNSEMMAFGATELFKSKHEVASFHDAINEVRYPADILKYTVGELRAAYDVLPDHIKFTALEWGLSDTEFRDSAYVWFKNNGLPSECVGHAKELK